MGSHLEKMMFYLFLILLTSINSKYTKVFKCKNETINVLIESMREFFHKLRVGNYNLYDQKKKKSQKQNSKRSDKLVKIFATPRNWKKSEKQPNRKMIKRYE